MSLSTQSLSLKEESLNHSCAFSLKPLGKRLLCNLLAMPLCVFSPIEVTFFLVGAYNFAQTKNVVPKLAPTIIFFRLIVQNRAGLARVVSFFLATAAGMSYLQCRIRS